MKSKFHRQVAMSEIPWDSLELDYEFCPQFSIVLCRRKLMNQSAHKMMAK